MQILMIGNFWKGWDGSICDEAHIAETLRTKGHEVVEWQREEIGDGSIVDGSPDFILVAQWNGYPPHFCRELKESYDCPVVYWAFDYQFDAQETWHMELAKEADLFLSKEMNNRRFYEDMGCNFKWLAQDFAPNFLDRVEGLTKDIDVLFTGTYLPVAQFRTDVLKAVDEKFDLHVYSITHEEWKAQGLKNVHKSKVDSDLPELYGRAKINLSVDWKIGAEGYWSDRNAQCMCCGGMVLFKYIPMSEVAFHDYVAYFDTIEECLEKIDYYLNDEQGQRDRQKLENRGWGYAQHNMKVWDRVEDMLTIVKEVL